MTTETQKDVQSMPAYTKQYTNQPDTRRATYLILDGASFDALSLIFANGVQPEFMLLYTNTELAEQLNISPVIVRYDNNPNLQSKYTKWQPHAIAFQTTADLVSTVEHLKSLIYCQLPNTQPAFFRFYAQSWLEPLITAQDQSTLYAFTGAIDQWFIPQADQRWLQLSITEQGSPKIAKDVAWFKLTEELQQQLSNFNYQQFITTLTQRYTQQPYDSDEYQAAYKQISYYVEEATNHDLHQEDHITAFVELAMTYRQQLETAQAIAIIDNPQELAVNRINALKAHLEQAA